MDFIKDDAFKDTQIDDRLIYGKGTSLIEWQNWKYLNTMPSLNLSLCFPAHQRVVIISPHPDDEILGCAGLIQKLDQLQRTILIVAVTNGTRSHPDSKLYPPQKLEYIRPQETLTALNTLKLNNTVERIALNITDGEISKNATKLYHALENILHKNDILICTFEKDGHPDHEVTGNVTQFYAHHHELRCYRVLIWAWHWAQPNDPQIPWHNTYKLNLNSKELRLKRQAISCFKSQIEYDSSTGQPPILSNVTIERLLQPYEVFIHG